MSEQPAAGWYVDPTSRYEHRYWDGGTWTEHVSRNGQATTDPLDGSASMHVMSQSADTATWQAQAGATTRTNTKAIVSLVISLVSLVLSLIWIGGLSAIGAVVIGVMAKREIRERPNEGGSGLATAGIILGILAILGSLLWLVAFLSFAVFGDAMSMAP